VLNRRLEISRVVECVCAASETVPSPPLEILQVDGLITAADSRWQTPWNTSIKAIVAQNVARVEFRDRNRQSPRLFRLTAGCPTHPEASLLSPRGQCHSDERERRWFVRRYEYVSKLALYTHECVAAKIQISVQVRALCEGVFLLGRFY
jgi:hypothetical protein